MKQTKLIGLVTVIFIVVSAIAISCKKNNDNPNNNDPITQIPAYVAPVDGALHLNISSLSLHPGNSVIVQAIQYDVTGNSITPTSLIWQSENPAVATVVDGLVTAIGEGSCAMTVTDGVHGILNLHVTVVNASIALPTNASQIDWNMPGDVLIMQPNSTKTLSGFTIYNSQGGVASGSLSFIPPSGSGLTFSGNDVTSGAVTGSFDVRVLVGTDTLNNTLKVLIGGNADTSYHLTCVSLPYFLKNDVSSAVPLLLKITKTWYYNSTLQIKMFTASPDKIEFSDGNVTLDASGHLKSVHVTDGNYANEDIGAGFGVTLIKLHYKGYHTSRHIYVAVNIRGNWGGSLANGDKYNYCIDQNGPDVEYITGEMYWFDPNIATVNIAGIYYIEKADTPFLYGNAATFGGSYKATSNNLFLDKRIIEIRHEGQPLLFHEDFRLGDNGDKMISFNTGVNLARDAGNCTGDTTQPTSSTGSFTFKGTTYGGPAFCIIDSLNAIYIHDPSVDYTVAIYNPPSSGTVQASDSTTMVYLFDPIFGGLAWISESGTVTKTSTGFNFSVLCYDDNNWSAPLETITGYIICH